MRNRIVVLLLVGTLGLGGLIVSACTGKGTHKEDSNISYYTCPMHPQIHKDHPGECPICGMELVPVKKGEQEGSWMDLRKKLFRLVTITADQQQLIGMKTATVEKKPVIKEIRTVGRVAFDPDLAIAQRGFLEIAKNVPSLRESAVSHLRLLGMGDEEIRSLEKGGKVSANLYLPKAGDSVWVYATLYQEEMEVVKPGMEAEISLPSGPDRGFNGTIRTVDPVINPVTRSGRARIEIPTGGGHLRPDAYVNVSLKVDLGNAVTIPRSAVIDTGVRKVVFVVTEGDLFQSRNIKTGPEVGEDVVVLDGIKTGEKVVSSGTFLVDSESQLRMAVASAPACPEGQSWDQGMSMCMPTPGK